MVLRTLSAPSYLLGDLARAWHDVPDADVILAEKVSAQL